MSETYYIVRCDRAGVFFGHIARRDGREVTITNVRRLWFWSGAATLSQLAQEGVKNHSSCKFTMTIPEITVLDAIELIPCSDAAVASIAMVSEWKM